MNPNDRNLKTYNHSYKHKKSISIWGHLIQRKYALWYKHIYIHDISCKNNNALLQLPPT